MTSVFITFFLRSIPNICCCHLLEKMVVYMRAAKNISSQLKNTGKCVCHVFDPREASDRRPRYEHVRPTFACCLPTLSLSPEEARRRCREHASGQQIPVGALEICPCCWHVGSVPFITHTSSHRIMLALRSTHTFDPHLSLPNAHPVSSHSVSVCHKYCFQTLKKSWDFSTYMYHVCFWISSSCKRTTHWDC